jgi:hypothetical protein
MANVKYDIKQVPRELLELFVELHSILDPHFVATSDVAKAIQKAAKVPLRTRAEIDADITKAVRDYVGAYESFKDIHLMDLKFKGCFDHSTDMTLPEVLKMLLAEETSD